MLDLNVFRKTKSTLAEIGDIWYCGCSFIVFNIMIFKKKNSILKRANSFIKREVIKQNQLLKLEPIENKDRTSENLLPKLCNKCLLRNTKNNFQQSGCPCMVGKLRPKRHPRDNFSIRLFDIYIENENKTHSNPYNSNPNCNKILSLKIYFENIFHKNLTTFFRHK